MTGADAAARPARRLRVGVDATSWANGRGYGRFTREILAALASGYPDDEFVLFVDTPSRAHIDLAAPNVSIECVDQGDAPTQAAAAGSYRSPRDMLRFTRAVWRRPTDVFFSPTVYTYFPLPPGRRAVVTIHDAIAERFPELTLPSRQARGFWNAKVRLAIWQARLLLTVSEYSARDLARVLGIAPSRIRTLVEAPSPAFVPSGNAADVERAARSVGIPPGARWITYVGGFNPHKHVDHIVKAHAAMRERRGEAPLYLVLVGDAGRDVFHAEVDRIRAAIAEAGTGDLVIWAGFVADEELRHLHSGAVALLLPSACEGFGLPAVEAAACGTPVIATTESPLPELLAGGGLFVSPGDVAGLTQALGTMLADEPSRRRMGATARQRAAALSWKASADVAMAALREAAG